MKRILLLCVSLLLLSELKAQTQEEQEVPVPKVEYIKNADGESIRPVLIRDVIKLATTPTPVDGSPDLNIRSCRTCTYYYIDGIKVEPPKKEEQNSKVDKVEEIKIITGGIPVDYGDVDSGVIRICGQGGGKR